jgi:hypothetical protein
VPGLRIFELIIERRRRLDVIREIDIVIRRPRRQTALQWRVDIAANCVSGLSETANSRLGVPQSTLHILARIGQLPSPYERLAPTCAESICIVATPVPEAL